MRVACSVLVRPPRAQLGWSTTEAGAPFETAPSWIVGDDEDTDSGAVLRREGELLPLTVRPSLLECFSPSPRGAPQLTMQVSFQLTTRRYLKRPERCGARTSQFTCRLFEAIAARRPTAAHHQQVFECREYRGRCVLACSTFGVRSHSVVVGAIVLQWFRGTRAQRGAKLPVKEAWRQGQQDTLSRTACSFLGHGLQNLVI